ncbi:MAG: histidine kinase [Flavobacteriaceae bacterium]|nr:histidine kinase [Flavobacteriaceae bacterium]
MAYSHFFSFMQLLNTIFIGLFALFGLLHLQAQPYRHFGLYEGLPTQTVYRVVQDNDGFIWVSHNKGISRFDGTDFTHFSTADGLPSNDIWLIDLDAQNRLWFFAKANRLGYIDKGKIHTFGNEDGLPFYPQNLYRGVQGPGFYSLQPGDAKYYYFENALWKTLETTAKNVKLADLKRKYFWLQDKNSIHITDSLGKSLLSIPTVEQPQNATINQLNDSIFIAFTAKEAFYINSKRLTHKHFTFKIPLELARITGSETQIQMSGRGQLYVFDLHFNLLKHIRTNPKVQETFNYLDKEGNLWSASVSDGLYFYPANLLQVQSYFEGVSIKKVMSFQNRLFVYHEKNGLLQKSLAERHFNEMHAAHESWNLKLIDNDQVLISLQGNNLWYFDQNVDAPSKKINPGIFIKSLARFNGQWYGVGKANVALSGDFKTVLKYFPYDAADQIDTNTTHLYIGGINGLKIFNGESFMPFQTSDSLSDKNISLLQAHNDSLMWVGTEKNGLYLADGTESRLVLLTKGKNITSLFRENAQTVWVVADDDLYRLQNQDFWKNETSKIDRLGNPNPLVSMGINAVSVLKDTLYIATEKGLHTLPKDAIFTKSQPYFYVDELSYQQQHLEADAVVKYQKNGTLSAHMHLLDFNPNGPTEFEYRLTPFSTEWQKAENGQISLTGLDPNSYTLELRSADLPGQTQSVSFYIQPLWWQTTAFKILVVVFVLLFTALIAGLWVKKWYVLKNKRLESLRQQTEHELHALRSQMNPHFIFNSLNAIQYYLTQKGPEASESYLLAFSKLIRMIFEYSSKKTISLKAEIKLLSSYLELEKKRFGNKLSFYIFVDDEIDEEKYEIPSLLLQPLVENAVNHGVFHSKNDGFIEIRFLKPAKDHLEIVIQDNGVGMAKSQSIYEKSVNRHHSKSTQILKDRIALINQTGRFHIRYRWEDLTDADRSGTRVVLEVEYPKQPMIRK